MLCSWLNKSKKHRDSFNEIADTTVLVERYEQYAGIDNEKAWETFSKTIGKEEIGRKKNAAHQRLTSMPHFFRYAAAIVLILLGGTLLWYMQYTKVSAPDISSDVRLAMQQSRQSGKTDAVIDFVFTEGKCQWNDAASINYNESSHSAAEKADTNVSKSIRSVAPESISTMTKEQMLSARRITTRQDKEFWLTLDDGTLVHLNYNTHLIYPEHFGRGDRNVILDGEAYFMVAKDKSRDFVVHTPQGDIKVYGTEFFVNTRSDKRGNSSRSNVDKIAGEEINNDSQVHQTTVVLVKGSISFTPTRGKEIMMTPSQRLIIDKDKQSINEIDTTPYTAWNTGLFVFTNSTLEYLMDVLSQWYGIQHVNYSNDNLRKILFTGNLKRYGPVERILEAIMIACDLNITMANDTITIQDSY